MKPNPSFQKKKMFFMWWKIDTEELAKQIQEYHTLDVFRSARQLSSVLLLVSCLITYAFISFQRLSPSAWVDIIIMGFFSFFCFQGKKWAFLGAMLIWTLEKVFAIATNPSSTVIQVIWWAIYMNVFYLAYMVEKERKNPFPPATENEPKKHAS